MQSRGAILGVDPGGACRSVGLRRRGCSCGERRGSRGWRRWLSGKGEKGGRGLREGREMRKHSPGGRGGFAPFLLVVEGSRAHLTAAVLGSFITKRRHWIPEAGPMGLEHVEEVTGSCSDSNAGLA